MHVMSRTRRIWIICCLVGLNMTWLLFALSVAGTARLSSDPIPDEALKRSEIARAHMKQIAQALDAYATANKGNYPPDLRMLYPKYISDPAVFWHPGDSDPKPTTIDNNEPNQPNSTRISYEYTSALYNTQTCRFYEPMVWDNSDSNNGGFLINKVPSYGMVM
ncbi:MAG TPA: hypothetical protein VLM89_05105, partial [Phycisphaerae bacterium]|nr:hypothetical protein [Phycisphaerae bacterium]